MSYERQDSTSRLQLYRQRQAERMEAMMQAIHEGRTTVVTSSPVPLSASEDVSHAHKEQIPLKAIEKETKSDSRLNKCFDLGNYKFFGPGLPNATAQCVSHALRTGPLYGSEAVQHYRSSMRGYIDEIFAHVLASIIAKDGKPAHGELFSYDAKMGKFVPLKIGPKKSIANTVDLIMEPKRFRRGSRKSEYISLYNKK